MADSVPLPNLFDDDNDFWPHPIYDKYEANRLGIVRHVVNKKDVGHISNSGYIRIDIKCRGNRKLYQKHRFIYECFFGLIEDPNMVVDHINNIKADNRLENLQLITFRENIKKDLPKGLNRFKPIRIKAINIKSEETSDYDSIKKCSKILDISEQSIRRVLNGIANSATSKKDKNIYRFEKI